MRFAFYFAVAVTAATPMAPVGSAAEPEEINLTSTWSCDDEGTYNLRQVGKIVWWVGKGEKGSKYGEWMVAYRGTIKGNEIIGSWCNISGGSSGEMTLRLHLKDGKVVEITQERREGDFYGGTVWTRQ